ncbi:MAG: hypothetical protein ACE5FP_06010, partial [Gemmatimonadota bacterium]
MAGMTVRSVSVPLVVVLTGLAAIAPRAHAMGPEDEPHLSIRTGLPCSSCHVNRTGGGARNDFGSVYGQTRLPMRQFKFVNRSLNSFLSVGANFRVRAQGAVSETDPRTDVSIIEESLQFEGRVVPDVLAVYIDQIVGPSSAFTREAFALLESLPLDGYVKAGKFLLPFGLRLADDQEFIRARTGFNYNTPDQGVEIGIEPGPLSFFAALTNGTQGAGETNSDKQLTGSVSLVFPRFRIGASASRNEAPAGTREVVGAFGGFNLGRFTVLGELDHISDETDDGSNLDQLVGFIEGDFLAVRGLNIKATYGFLDPNRDIGENARVRLRFGVETFPIQNLQVSAFYTLLEDIP